MQTGQYSTQIFSLAVLLSSLFVYNQMGGIDEASIDQLALVAEMSKKIMMNSSRQQIWFTTCFLNEASEFSVHKLSY